MAAVMWTERSVSGVLARNTFSTALCVLPNAGWGAWTGEVDMLVIPPCRRCIDVEIKVSRADLKVDAKKGKWWRDPYWRVQDTDPPPRIALEWPVNVWKHYYAIPADIWKPELLDVLPSKASGVLLVHDREVVGRYSWGRVSCARASKPNRDAQPIGDAELRQIARLASLRMWDAYRELDAKRCTEAA